MAWRAGGFILMFGVAWLASTGCGATERGDAPVTGGLGNQAGAEPRGGWGVGASGGSGGGSAGSGQPSAGVPGGGMTNGGSTAACEVGDNPTCIGNGVSSCPDGEPLLTECEEGYACVPGVPYARCEALDLLELGATENEFGFAWRNAYMLVPCLEKSPPSDRCRTLLEPTCPNQDSATFEGEQGLVLKQTFEVGGELGTLYTAHLVVNGIVEGKYYQNGTRDRGTTFSNHENDLGTDTFHRGGSAIPSLYGVHRLSVFDANGQRLAHYYLNSFPQASGAESFQTFAIAYEKDIDVPGGGTVEYMSQDPDCVTQDNCGVGGGFCGAPRHIPNEPGVVLPQSWGGKPLASWNVLTGGQEPFHANLIHLRVTKIALKSPVQ